MALRALSLCAGIGGIDLGLERIGAARTVCYVEREAFPAACLVAAMQRGDLADAPVWSDLRTFDARAWRGAVDLVVGGYPCQPFSLAGKRGGANDERHLWPEVLRIYRDSGARFLFCENVAGHLSLGFADVLADLAEIGADVEWSLFRASDVGAPHRRERLFFLADRDSERCEGVEEFNGDAQSDSADGNSRGRHADGRGFDVADTRRERDQLERGSEDVARAPRDVEGEGNQRERSRDAARDCGEFVANAADIGHERLGTARRRRDGLADGERDVGDAERSRADAYAERSGSRRADRQPSGGMGWPPGPRDAEGWRNWIELGGPQPVVRGGAHGVPNRLDRLRALGNSVVPACAALAWQELSRGRVK